MTNHLPLIFIVSFLSACGHQQYHAPEDVSLSVLHIQTASKNTHIHDVLFTQQKICTEDEVYSLGALSRDDAIKINIPSQQQFEFIINSYATLKLTKDSHQQEISCTASLAFTPKDNTQYYARHWVSQDAKNCTIRLFDKKGKILPSKEIVTFEKNPREIDKKCLSGK